MSSQEQSLVAPALTPEQTRAFDDILAVFASPGWRHLQKELESQRDAVANVRTTKDLAFAHGQLSVLDPLSNWKSLWENLYAGAQSGAIEVSPEFGK